MKTSNRRREQRLPINIKVIIRVESVGSLHLVTSDFSEGGIYVKNNQLCELPIDSIVSVQSDEGMANAPIIQARIAWSDNNGVGIQYLLD